MPEVSLYLTVKFYTVKNKNLTPAQTDIGSMEQ